MRTWIFRETDGERRLLDLLFEQIFLVEEEDDRGFREPLVVTDRIEQFHALHHSILNKNETVWWLRPHAVTKLYIIFISTQGQHENRKIKYKIKWNEINNVDEQCTRTEHKEKN